MNTPCILKRALDDVGCGAMLKNTETDIKAIIVDFVGPGQPLVCIYHGDEDEDESKEPSFTETDYSIHILTDFTKWIVLHMGQDEHVLVD